MLINSMKINLVVDALAKHVGRTEAEALALMTLIWGGDPCKNMYNPSKRGVLADLSIFPEETVEKYLKVLGW